MNEDAARLQVIEQCKAVAHLAQTLADLHRDYADGLARGCGAVEIAGPRTAAFMEVLGDMLNGMDAVDEDEDGWLAPVFAAAHELYGRKS